jgi:RHS repeat-associated protein
MQAGSSTMPLCACASRYTGKERDTESGLDSFGARYYASTMGRMMSPDWSAESDPVPYADLNNPQSLNLYAYVGNNPLSHTDSDGHDEDDDEDEGEGQATLVAPAATATAEAIGTGGPIVIAPSVTPLIVGCAILCATEMGNDPAEQRYLKTLGQPRVTPSPTDSQVNSPTMDEHTRRRGSKKKTNDKHTKPRPGRNNTKDRQNPNWRPYRDYVKPKNPTPRPPMPTPLPDPTPPPSPPPKDKHGEPSY